MVLDPDGVGPQIPIEFGAQVTADHIVNNDGGDEDDGIPHDTVADV